MDRLKALGAADENRTEEVVKEEERAMDISTNETGIGQRLSDEVIDVHDSDSDGADEDRQEYFTPATVSVTDLAIDSTTHHSHRGEQSTEGP